MKEDPHLLTLTALPPEGPYLRYELTAPGGEILASGEWPPDPEVIREASASYHERIDKVIYSKFPFKKP